MSSRIELVVFGTDDVFLNRLKEQAQRLAPEIRFAQGTGPDVNKQCHLDAMWSTLMAAEYYGVSPPFPVHEALVVSAPQSWIDRGMPRYGIFGVPLAEDDPRNPTSDLEIVVRALKNAVEKFNSASNDKITRVGILPENLCLDKIAPSEAFAIIREGLCGA